MTEEVEHAQHEGVQFKILTAPVKVLGNKEGWVCGLECVEMELGEPNAKVPRATGVRFIEKVLAADPLECPDCGGTTRVVAFIEDRRVARAILEHLSLSDEPRPPPAVRAVPRALGRGRKFTWASALFPEQQPKSGGTPRTTFPAGDQRGEPGAERRAAQVNRAIQELDRGPESATPAAVIKAAGATRGWRSRGASPTASGATRTRESPRRPRWIFPQP